MQLSKIGAAIKAPASLQKLFGYTGYGLFFFGACLLFSYCSFPYDRARIFVEGKVAEAIPGAQLRVVSLSPSWFTGIEATGVQLSLPSAVPGERPTMLTLRRAYARLQILPLLVGRREVAYDLTLDNGGRVYGTASQSIATDVLDLTLANVDLRMIGPIRKALGIPVQGIASGTVQVTLADDAPSTVGAVDLTIRTMAAGDGRAQISIPSPFGAPMALTIDRIDGGILRLRGPIENGVLRLQELSGRGTDVELRGSGSIRLLRNVRLSSADILLRIDVKPAYRTRSDRTTAIFSLVDTNPLAAAFKAADGAFQLRLQGPLFRVTALPAGSANIP